MSDVLISREHLQELIDCADVPDEDPCYHHDLCIECNWEDLVGKFYHLPNIEKHNPGCAKQNAIKAAMKALEI